MFLSALRELTCLSSLISEFKSNIKSKAVLINEQFSVHKILIFLRYFKIIGEISLTKPAFV